AVKQKDEMIRRLDPTGMVSGNPVQNPDGSRNNTMTSTSSSHSEVCEYSPLSLSPPTLAAICIVLCCLCLLFCFICFGRFLNEIKLCFLALPPPTGPRVPALLPLMLFRLS